MEIITLELLKGPLVGKDLYSSGWLAFLLIGQAKGVVEYLLPLWLVLLFLVLGLVDLIFVLFLLVLLVLFQIFIDSVSAHIM